MASIQRKGDGWYCQFLFRGRRDAFAIGKVDEDEARNVSASVGYVLMRLKQGMTQLPAGADIVTFVLHSGQPPEDGAEPVPETSFADFPDAYLKTVGDGAIESNTLETVEIHLDHFASTLGERFPMGSLSLSHLQRHIDRRKPKVAGVMNRKEIDSLRTAWNWSARMGSVSGDFPATGLIYPKEREKLPFMTWAEIERRIKAGGNPK
jgi:hypothetical protein